MSVTAPANLGAVAPVRGGKAGLFGGAGMGKTVLLTEMIHNKNADPFGWLWKRIRPHG
jgi:F0F1-type ATP synthase beta subunit